MSSIFEDLQREGKILAAQGYIFESLQKFEQAREIRETPKILHRIQKLKDFMKQNNIKEPRKHSSENSQKSIQASSKEKSAGKISPVSQQDVKQVPMVLNQIQNIEVAQKIPEKENTPVTHKSVKTPDISASIPILLNTDSNVQKEQKIPDNPKELTPEDLEKFNALKKRAKELSYVANFQDALETFAKALNICACPKVKKFYQEIELMASQHAKELAEIQNLTNTGKKLAKEGKRIESVKKLQEAYTVCPSPSISKMIKMQEVQNATLKYSPNKNPIHGELKEKHSFTPKQEVPASHNELVDVCRDPSALSPAQLAKFQSLYQMAKKDAAAGKLQAALNSLLEAKSICPTAKLLKRIKDLQEHIKISDGASDDKMVSIADGFSIFHEIYDKLYPYQRDGVAWMWKLYKKKKGGVLGDDMGLGKTFQVIAFLSGLIDADLVKHILIIMPVSLLPNWEKEFKKWCPGISVSTFHGNSKKEKERSIYRVQRRGHVLLTSYGMVVGNLTSLTQLDGKDFVWDYVILDEGHKIKNPTKTTKAVHGIPSRMRLVLTGTPIQNNLRELWALYDFAHQGTLLGSMKTFKMTYEAIITRSREKDATAGEKRYGTEMANNLKKLIDPYFLRRTKAEVWGVLDQNSDITNLEQNMENLDIAGKKLTRKNDLIVWIYLSEAQCEIYKNFLHSDAVKTILVSKRSPLVELTVLKKICDHPRLLSHRACLQLGLNGKLSEEELSRVLDDESSYASTIENVSDDTLIEESGKMRFLLTLLENLRENNHRTLVFSLSRKILDMIHRILVNRNWKVIRIDGTISKIEERERRIQLFQKDSSYSVFLLTTQVGGVGITLTAADRVVIYDPSWNPATDAQAVDRVYRIGQEKNVVVYRLITCGSVEEKIYRRQIFKDSITRQATGASDPHRYFSKQELRELFSLDNPHHSATQVQLSQMHSDARQSDTQLDEHIAFLHSLNVFGISDHDLMFTKTVTDHTEDNDEAAVSHDFIQKQVLMAQARIQDEAAVVEEGIRLAGSYYRPFSEPIPTSKKSTKKDSYVPPVLPDIIDLTNEIDSVPSPHRERNSRSSKNSDSLKAHNNQSPKRKSVLDTFTKEQKSHNDTKSITNSASPSYDVFSPKIHSNQEGSFSDYSPLNNLIQNDVEMVKANHPNNFLPNDVKIKETSEFETKHEMKDNESRYTSLNEHVEENLPEKIAALSSSSTDYISSDIVPPTQSNQCNVSPFPLHGQSSAYVEELEKSVHLENLIENPTYNQDSSNTKTISMHLDDDNEVEYVGENFVKEKSDDVYSTNQELPLETETISVPEEASLSSSAYRTSNVTSVMNSDDSSAPASPNSSRLSVSSSRASLNSTKSSIARNSNVFEELDFEEEPTVKRKVRKSCARPGKYLSGSDSSRQTSVSSSANNSDNEVIVGSDSEYEDSDVIDNSCDEDSNVSVVPSSIPNSPAQLNTNVTRENLSIRRITPLRLRKSFVPSNDSPFAKALANSPIILADQEGASSVNSSDPDSPVLIHTKKKNVIVSDSSSEEDE